MLGVQHAEDAGAGGGELAQVAEREVEVLALAADRLRRLRDPVAEGLLRLRVEDPQDLVELHRRLDLRAAQRGAVAERAVLAVAGRQLDVGLAEQRLLAQDRARVARDRRVLRVDVERGGGGVAAPVELLREHLSDGDPGDPDVGLLSQRRGLGEVDLELVLLRLQRDRPAEREPQEQQDAERREREDHHRGDAREARSVLRH